MSRRTAWPLRQWLLPVLLLVALLATIIPGLAAAQYAPESLAVFDRPTYSSPIALSANNALLWVVNPDDDTVSVIRTDTDAVIKKITVGDEPQSVAVGPANTYAYVANAGDNTVTVIKITDPNPANFVAAVDTAVGINGHITTGAEPWNIVSSPDGQRMFVANSGQDTITIINNNNRTVVGNVNLRDSVCNDPDRSRQFQPRGLAVTQDNTILYVTRFLSFTKPGGVQGDDNGKAGIVCRVNINTGSANIADYVPVAAIALAAQVTGFRIDSNGDGTPDDTAAYPNQLQSIVLRGDRGYLPNIAASPSGPLRFNVDTQAFVNMIGGVTGATQTDLGALNLHLGARTNTPRLFFANPWAIAFTTQSGVGNAYVVSAASDLLVKLNVDAQGELSFTNNISSTAFIDLNNAADPATSGANAGKNPLGIAINPTTNKAYVMNYVSRNVSVVDLNTDRVTKVIKTTDLPPPDTLDETVQVGKEIFFSSRGVFNRPSGTTVSTTDRLSSEGWQACSSCHFAGLTDANIWVFGAGPRKSVPLNASFNPHNPADQRVLNYSAIFDEVEDFELNIRNVSGPASPPGAPLDVNHGLLISDTSDINAPPAVINAFAKPNAGRPQHTVTLPGSSEQVPALEAMRQWVRFGVRTPNGMLTTVELTGGGGNATGGVNPADVEAGRLLFFRAGCHTCHGGGKWTNSTKDFLSPPAADAVFTERSGTFTGNPIAAQYLDALLEDIGSFNLGVAGQGNPIGNNVGAPEKASGGFDALGIDYNADGAGLGFNVPSLLGIYLLQPYYHNGACETLACVVGDVRHRTANSARPDVLTDPADRARLVAFLQTIDADTAPPANLLINRHDIFLDPPVVRANSTVVVGANVSLFGPRVDPFTPGPLRVTFYNGVPGGPNTSVIGQADLSGFPSDFSQRTVTATWNVPNFTGALRIFAEVDTTNLFTENNEVDNVAFRRIVVRPPVADAIPPEVTNVRINDDQAVATTPNVVIKFDATDAGGSGLDAFCVVHYEYDSATRRWVERECTFAPLPAPSGNTFAVDVTLPSSPGVAYVFVWVKDKAGNIASAPGFDFISFVPSGVVNMVRNEVRVFRFKLLPGQFVGLNVLPTVGDVDVTVFEGVAADATVIDVSANRGTAAESVFFDVPGNGATTIFHVEIRARANSQFTFALTALAEAQAHSPAALTATDRPIVAGPPALRAAIDDLHWMLVPYVLD